MVEVNGNAPAPEKESPYKDDADYKKLIERGYNPKVAGEVVAIIQSGLMNFEDLEERTLEQIKSMKPDQASYLLTQFKEADLLGIQTPAAFLGTYAKVLKDRIHQQGASTALSIPLIRSPDTAKMNELMNKSGFSLEVTIGQRKYGGPPPNWTDSAPGAGCECYVGKLPNDMFEDELIPLFEEIGPLYDFRLMMDPMTCKNKGYGFVTFLNKEDAAAAAKKYDDHVIKDGKRMKVNVSVANTRLFVGNIPKTKSKEELLEELKQYADNIVDLIVFSSPEDPEKKRNRGFCFVDFLDHKSASDSKRKLQSGRVRPWGREVFVDWAESQQEVDEETMKTVKVLYVRNLKESVTEETLKPEFEKFGEIEKIKRLKDYAFVHYKEREHAVAAMEALNQHVFDGSPCEISLAKPQGRDRRKRDEKNMRQMRGRVFGGGGGFRGARGSFNGPPRGRGSFHGPQGGFGFSYGYGYDDYNAAAYGPYDPWSGYYGGGGYDEFAGYGYEDYYGGAAAMAYGMAAGGFGGRGGAMGYGMGMPRGGGFGGGFGMRGGGGGGFYSGGRRGRSRGGGAAGTKRKVVGAGAEEAKKAKMEGVVSGGTNFADDVV